MKEKDVDVVLEAINSGEYDKAMMKIESALKSLEQADLTNDTIFLKNQYLLLLKSQVHIEQNNYIESLDLSQSVLDNKSKLPNTLPFMAYILKAEVYWRTLNDDGFRISVESAGQYNLNFKASYLIDIDDWRALYLKCKGNLLKIDHKYNEAIDKFSESLSLYESLGKLYHQAMLMENISLCYRILGKLDQAENYIIDSINIFEKLENIARISKSKNILGIIVMDKKDFKKASNIFMSNLSLLQELDDKEEISRAYCNISLMLLNQGKLVSAKKYALDALEMAKILNDDVKSCRYLINLGLIYWHQSNYSEALVVYNKSLDIINNKKFELDKEKVLVLGNLGYLYSDLGDIKQSEFYFNRAISFLKTIENYEEIAEYMHLPYYLLGLIKVYIQLNQGEKSSQFFEELSSINKKYPNKYNNDITNLAHALILKSKPNLADKFKSQNLLEQIIKQEIIDYKFLLIAIFHLCDLYLIELKVSDNPETLNNLTETIDKMISISDKQNMPVVKAQAYILKSKISLISLEVDKALNFIQTSKDIGIKNELTELMNQIEKEENHILANINKWKLFVDSNSNITRILKETQVEEFLKLAIASYSPK